MNRAQAVTYLSAKYARIASDTGRTATDDADGYGVPIDEALRMIGTAEADIASADITADVPDYLIALRVATLEQFWSDYATNVDISVGDPAVDKKRSQAFKQVGEMLKAARAEAENAGIVTGANSWQMGRFTTDYLETALADLT